MRGRPVDMQRLAVLHTVIRQYHGRRPAWYAEHLGWQRKAVARALASAERIAPLFSEDDRGRLYPWEA